MAKNSDFWTLFIAVIERTFLDLRRSPRVAREASLDKHAHLGVSGEKSEDQGAAERNS